MAKGDPSGKYVPDTPTTESVQALGAWLERELLRVSSALELAAETIEFRNVAPAKPREGLTVGADGTNWNPGGGKGVYTYYSGAWNKLG